MQRQQHFEGPRSAICVWREPDIQSIWLAVFYLLSLAISIRERLDCSFPITNRRAEQEAQRQVVGRANSRFIGPPDSDGLMVVRRRRNLD